MRTSIFLVALTLLPLSAAAQRPEPATLVRDALEATAELAAASAKSSDPRLAAAAERARLALAEAVEALKTQPLCRPPPVIDPITFGLLQEEIRRGNRTGTLPASLILPFLARHLVTVVQLKALLEFVPLSRDRLEVVRVARDRIVDPETAAELYALFPLRQDQRALAQLLAW
jgi:hypothetical protein